MAEENRDRNATRPEESKGPKETREGTERLLREQELVNEREDQPQNYGGMATPPVETAERARPSTEDTPSVKEGEARQRPTDIQSEGA